MSTADVDHAKIQEEFVRLLSELTASGKAQWVQRKVDIGFIFCLAEKDLIVFEVKGGEPLDNVDPSGDVAGVVCKFRNVTYLWLEGLHGWDLLLSLLK
jgi:hypothetical protein